MWSARHESLANGRILRYWVDADSSPISYSEVLILWQHDADFRTFFMDLLARAPFSAFRWETPPLATSNVARPFEFVLLNTPWLERALEPQVFAAQFMAAKEDVLAFPNLGNDATLIVPCPRGRESAYVHLAAFVREAPEAQRHALWTAVGREMQQKLDVPPVWLSTAGAGVAWLHVRLDSRPKYYGHEPYRDFAR